MFHGTPRKIFLYKIFQRFVYAFCNKLVILSSPFRRLEYPNSPRIPSLSGFRFPSRKPEDPQFLLASNPLNTVHLRAVRYIQLTSAANWVALRSHNAVWRQEATIRLQLPQCIAVVTSRIIWPSFLHWHEKVLQLLEGEVSSNIVIESTPYKNKR